MSLSPRVLEALLVVPLAGGVAVVAARANKDIFRFLVAEDSLLEWLQVPGFVAAAALATLVAVRLRARGEPLAAAAFALLAVAGVFVAGEEIAWGQRLFRFETPEGFAELNKQGETTLHNVGTAQYAFNHVMLVAGAYGVAAPWAARLGRVRLRTAALLVPPLAASSCFAVVFVYKLVRLAVVPESGYTVTKVGEWAETCFALGLAVAAFAAFARTRSAAGAEERAEAQPVALGDAEPQQAEVAPPGAAIGGEAGSLLPGAVHPARVEERLG